MSESTAPSCEQTGSCLGRPLCPNFPQSNRCYQTWMNAGPPSPKVLHPTQAQRPIEWCRDGYHCTCHPYEGDVCCRCGSADFDVPRPGAGLTPEQARPAA